MRMNALWWMLTGLVIAGLALLGCAQKKTESETPPAAQQVAPGGEAAEHEEGGPIVTPAGSVPEIWTQIGAEQAKLAAAIENGQLKAVHHLAFGIRDLVVALAGKAGASSPAVKPQLDGMVQQITALATKLDELGDAGNLSGTQAEFTKLGKTLEALRAVTGTR
jgi:hypothetical protein